ncbi:SH3 domain-containing protein [Patescibacteria group bacterium]|nr:SH3 domain-containing protein [Patescibacteria group bacterium]MBU0777319.1 SH3 domain-containing protein [Patescibacteria group bacterium]MBU0846101.1 SH3 domain-containing protein [Patescibacteria group bacterium]MBU0923154.1 SH3 domain-containing protein [Patescibacteria group bacterium]MBU1066869.1 SH3 domain-containing protein [Patescibacteria group bacterium]
MVTAQTVQKQVFVAIAVSALAGALVFPRNTLASAGSPQDCTVSSSCTVGEFLYDDSYVPITTADCTITSRYPDGSLHLNGEVMSKATDGWYYHTFTAPTTTGLYRAQVCCTASGDYLCLDKSYEVKASSTTPSTGDISSAVWGYSGRTLSNFGDLISNIWSNASRSLTSLNAGDEDAIDISSMEATINENRLLLERLVNEPIIQNFIEEEETPDLGEKLEQTKSVANTLYVNNQYLRSKASLLVTKWSKLSERELLSNVMELSAMLGDEGDSDNKDTIFGQINWLKEAWGWKATEDVYNQAIAIGNVLSATQYRLGSYGKTNFAYNEIKGLVGNIDRLETLVGDAADSSNQRTLFGKIKEVRDLADIFETRKGDIDNVLAKWNSTRANDRVSKINTLYNKIIAINRLPRIEKVLGASTYKDTSDEKILKNKLLSLKGLIQANETFLAKKAGSTIASTWLELGSIVFKSLITNPSSLISQTVPLKYYLPPEVREEDIISTDDDLTVKYDAEQDQYYVEGEFTLGAGQTKTVSIQVNDIWVITEEQVESLRKQAEELSRPLEKTSYFAQGVTLKSDIDVSLDKIIELQKTAITPEQKIRAYREAEIELDAVNTKMDKLQELVTEAGSIGTLFGFVGSTQTLAVWGMIVIVAGGFIFLAVYMKTLRDKEMAKSNKKKTQPMKMKTKTKKTNGEARRRIRKQVAIRLAVLFILFGAGIAALTAFITSKVITAKIVSQQVAETIDESEFVLGEQEEAEVIDLEEEELEEDATGGEDIVMVEVPVGSSVNIREEPSLTSAVIMRLKVTQEVVRIGEEGDWANIAFVNEKEGDYTEGWVYLEFVVEGVPFEEDSLGEEEFESLTDPIGGTVMIEDTPTGWLRVRKAPGGIEIAKVEPGESFALIDEKADWYQIELNDGTLGWVSKEYSSLEY